VAQWQRVAFRWQRFQVRALAGSSFILIFLLWKPLNVIRERMVFFLRGCEGGKTNSSWKAERWQPSRATYVWPVLTFSGCKPLQLASDRSWFGLIKTFYNNLASKLNQTKKKLNMNAVYTAAVMQGCCTLLPMSETDVRNTTLIKPF
jgi:hypothetical protein